MYNQTYFGPALTRFQLTRLYGDIEGRMFNDWLNQHEFDFKTTNVHVFTPYQVNCIFDKVGWPADLPNVKMKFVPRKESPTREDEYGKQLGIQI